MSPVTTAQDDSGAPDRGVVTPAAPAGLTEATSPQPDSAQGGATGPTSGWPDAVRLLVPLATALIVGIFVALGIEGDTRSRLLRNQPGQVFLAFALVMIGLTIPILMRLPERASAMGRSDSPWPGRLRAFGAWVGAALVLGGALVAFRSGAQSFEEREQPSLSATATLVQERDDLVEVSVRSSALSLKSSERMLLRVVVFSPQFVAASTARASQDPTGGEILSRPCWDSSGPGTELRSLTDDERKLPLGPEPARVLHWGESGPTSQGTVSSNVTVTVPLDEFSHLCAYAALTTRQRASATPASTTDGPTERATPAATATASATSSPTTDPQQGERRRTDRFSRLVLDLRTAARVEAPAGAP